ncbi:hypothetical protein ACGF3G_23050 [Streptomyces sp. NPDC048179]|uniref:hypothetical protein n=1 Tax=Streptomyces sp. NPDC048179 TaxID=3365506 RepID=UPI0037106FDF
MILLVPVSRFHVTYEVGVGRPYSRLEELVCRLIAEADQPVTLTQLRDTFQVHDRLLLESVVTLVRAGWAAMDIGVGLVVTEQGRQTLSEGGRPHSTIVRKAHTSLYMERVCGLLQRETQSRLNVRTLRDLRSVMTRSDLERSLVTVRNPRNSLSVGQAQGLLPHRPGEWIRRVAEPRMQTKANEFMPVAVDLPSRTVTGLPRSWEPLLSGALLREAEERAEEMREFSHDEISQLVSRHPSAGPNRSAIPQNAPDPLLPGSTILLQSTDEFLTAAHRAVEQAQTSILIMTPELSSTGVRTLEPLLKAALERGVCIDVLWGTEQGDNGEGRADLKRVAAQSTHGPIRSLRFNDRPAGTVSRMVIADSKAERGISDCTAVLGGFSMLDAQGPADCLLPGLLVHDPAVVAQLARAAAGWWAETPGQEFSAAIDRWRSLASRWEEITRSPLGHHPAARPADRLPIPGDYASARVVLDVDCAMLDSESVTPETKQDVIVRAYPYVSAGSEDEFGNIGSVPLRGAVAVYLRSYPPV